MDSKNFILTTLVNFWIGLFYNLTSFIRNWQFWAFYLEPKIIAGLKKNYLSRSHGMLLTTLIDCSF